MQQIFLLLVGAAIGFLAGRWKDSLDAKETKQAFLKAVHYELMALAEQLNATRTEIQQSLAAFRSGRELPPRMVGTIRTTVFSTQLSKLKSLADPLVMDIIKLYSDVGVIERIMKELNDQSAQYVSGGDVIKGVLKPAIDSTALTLEGQLSGFLRQIVALMVRLPKVSNPDKTKTA